MPRSSYDNLGEHPECLKERQPFHEQVTFAFVGYLVLVDLRQRADSMRLGGFFVIAALGEKLKNTGCSETKWSTSSRTWLAIGFPERYFHRRLGSVE
jgi:hypothetical protein